MSKKTVIFLIVVVTAMLLIGGFWHGKERFGKAPINSTNSEKIPDVNTPTSWQVFTVDSIGISLKLPQDWENKSITNDDKSILGIFEAERRGTARGIEYDPNPILGGDYTFIIEAYNSNSDKAKKFESFLNHSSENADGVYQGVSFGRKITLPDETQALRNVIEGPGKTISEQRGNNITYSFEKNNKYYEVHIVYDGNGMSGGVGEKILSTMVFTK